ncbi:MAG: endonuclease [Altererythrobacter sp.]|uniref:endonuclease/exonuclease/phosphatase family protein n=1 Tax=uncultured Altererythrobacter sp. TaxID=500840 RepID=UPI0017A4CEE4|nr:endonuclease/exonuclease/phosphatase family protein [uncultured Altererythrobacter sp.]NNE49747.1 endonuclease [Altererythrobacter sp.]NNF94610.1 endonuclease [Altererythrobacter sp.]NNK45883.1 endonuclease [Altererythrobacter sp.]
MQLTFASYNIHKAVGLDARRNPERIITVLRELDADIIALQEVDRRFGPRSSVLPRALLDDTRWRPLPVAKRRRSLGWHGNALLVRRDIECVHAEPLDLPTLEPRGSVLAELEFQGQNIRILGAHLDLSGLRRRDQIKAILKHCALRQRMPTVIMGDFNQWGRLTGAMRSFGMAWQQITPGPSYPSSRPIARLDRIVATPDWSYLDSGVHHSAAAAVASDHLPVFARLQLPIISSGAY